MTDRDPAEALTDESLEAIERALMTDPLIAQAVACVPEDGQRPWAVLRADPAVVESEGFVNLFEQLRFRAETAIVSLPVAWRPRGCTVSRDGIPVGPGGKPDRAALAEALGPSPGRAFPAVPTGEEPVPDAWRALLRQLLEPARHPDPWSRAVSLELDLGLDSLDRLDFVLSVAAALGRDVPDRDPARLFTLGDLVDYFGESSARERPALAAPLSGVPQRVLEPLDRRSAPAVAAPARLSWPALRVARAVGLAWARKKLGFSVHGLDRVEWSRRPLIVAQNHQSVLDGVLLPLAVPAAVHRELFSVGYAGYFSRGRGRWAGRLARIEPIDADSWALTGLRAAAAALRAGRVMVIYPEGERSIDGSLKPFKRSVAWLAAYSGAHVVPSAVAGSYQAWPRGWGFVPHPVSMTFGRPLPPPSRLGDSIEEAAWLQVLRGRIDRLMRELGADPDRGDPRTWAHGPPGSRR
jgi:long-chain acyl-CoA synthetase